MGHFAVITNLYILPPWPCDSGTCIAFCMRIFAKTMVLTPKIQRPLSCPPPIHRLHYNPDPPVRGICISYVHACMHVFSPFLIKTTFNTWIVWWSFFARLHATNSCSCLQWWFFSGNVLSPSIPPVVQFPPLLIPSFLCLYFFFLDVQSYLFESDSDSRWKSSAFHLPLLLISLFSLPLSVKALNHLQQAFETYRQEQAKNNALLVESLDKARAEANDFRAENIRLTSQVCSRVILMSPHLLDVVCHSLFPSFFLFLHTHSLTHSLILLTPYSTCGCDNRLWQFYSLSSWH